MPTLLAFACSTSVCNIPTVSLLMHANTPHRLVVRTSRCGRDNPGSTPGAVMQYARCACAWRLRTEWCGRGVVCARGCERGEGGVVVNIRPWKEIFGQDLLIFALFQLLLANHHRGHSGCVTMEAMEQCRREGGKVSGEART